MHFKDKRFRRALSAWPAALLVLFALGIFAGAEFVMPSDTPPAEESGPSDSISDSSSDQIADSPSEEILEFVPEAIPPMPESETCIYGTLFTNSHETLFFAEGNSAQYLFTPSRDDSYIFRSFPEGDAPLPDMSVAPMEV